METQVYFWDYGGINMEELLDYISNLPKPTTSIEKRAFIQEKKAFVVSDNNLEDECYNCHTKVPSRFIDIYIPEEKGIAHVKYFHTDSKQPFKKCKETFKNKRRTITIRNILVGQIG